MITALKLPLLRPVLTSQLASNLSISRRVIPWVAALSLFLALGVQTAVALTPPSGTTTTLTVKSSGVLVTSVAVGNVVTLTANVTAGGSSVTTGQVSFCDAAAAHCTDVHLLGVAQLTSAGVATYRFVPAAGTHSYKAVFAATQVDSSSASTNAPLQVTGSYPTTTTIAQSGSTGNYTLSATVTAALAGGNAPSGSVSFLDTSNGNHALGSALLTGGTPMLSFSAASTPATGVDPFAAVVGDFNNDGFADIVTANNGSNQLTILLGHGDGTFTAAASPSTGANPFGIVAGDFNHDGNLDLAVTNIADGTLTILLGHGDGTFTAAAASPLALGFTPGAVVTADLDGDGLLDLAVADITNNRVGIFSGNGDGTFAAPLFLATGAPAGFPPLAIATGDVNQDGMPEVVVLNADTTYTLFTALWPHMHQTTSRSSTGTTGGVSIALADIDGNGTLDLLVADFASNSVKVLSGDGTGGFGATASLPTGLNPDAIVVADVNGDGIPDLMTANFGDSTVSILLGKGDGTFTAATSSAVGSYPYGMATGIFTADGSVAPAVVNLGDSTVSVLHGQLSQTAIATATSISPVGTGTHTVEASYPDDSLYVGSLSATTDLNAQLAATTLVLVANPSSSAAGQLVTLTATLSPTTAQGHSATGSVVFYNGSTSIGSSALTSGLGVLSISTLPAGTDSLTAVYSGDTNFATSTSSVVTEVVNPLATKTQTITFGGLANQWFNPAPITLVATASSGLPVTYTVTLGQATVSGNTLTVNASYSGAVRVTVNQAGNGTYLPAAAVSQTFAVLPQGFVWTPASPITYGTTFAGEMTATHGSVAGTYVYTYAGTPLTANSVLGAGTYILIANFTPTGNGPVIKIPATLTVVPAVLTVTAQNATATYSSQVPTYGYTITGYVNGDTASVVTGVPSITTSATIRATITRGVVILTSPVGTYSINAHWGNLATNKNYTFVFAPGTLTITPTTNPLTITARNVTVAKASLIPSTFSYTVTGLAGFDTVVTAGTGTPSVTTTATSSSAAGSYPITAAAGTFAAPNYTTVNYVNGTLIIK